MNRNIRSLKSLILCIVVCAWLIPPAKAQLAAKYAGYEQNHFKGMRYGLFKPANYDATKSYPLIVYLHGSRDTVSRDNAWYHDDIQSKTPCFVLTPKSVEPNLGWGDTWRDSHPEDMTKTLELVDALIKRYAIDTNRLYLYGISMGGFGVFSVLAKEPGKFAAAYAICGGSNTNAADKLLETPLWIFHGEADDIVPVRLSRNVYNEMIKLGGKLVKYTEYPGVKHNSWENVAKEKTLPQWLLSQAKTKTTTSLQK
ncbi:MAG TPA: prolyl oligopeptidase family serine peptidase [Ohtaekwangia sp.]|nr:prolyl oligopeptidase family serine peptidase [Ohtaekwangia sp.]